MTLEERLSEAGVETLEELEAKIRTEAEAKAVKEKEALKEQVKNLETIKASQANEVGDARKAKEAAEAALKELKELKESTQTDKGNLEDRGAEKTDDDWKQANAEREKTFTDEDWAKLDQALKDAPAEVKALAKTEEGRAAFYASTFGSKESPETLETFRRPEQKKKLSVAEQMDAYLNKNKSQYSVPSARPSAIGASNPNHQPKTTLEVSTGDGWGHLKSLRK